MEERTKKTPHRRSCIPKQNGTALRLLLARQDMRLVRTHIQIEDIILFTLLTIIVPFPIPGGHSMETQQRRERGEKGE